MPSLPLGNKDRIDILRYHLVCCLRSHLMQMPTHPLPLTQATRQKILRTSPFPTALNGPFADPLFALLSALQNSLWMRCQLYFRINGFIFKLCLLYTIRVHLSSTFFHRMRTSPDAQIGEAFISQRSACGTFFADRLILFHLVKLKSTPPWNYRTIHGGVFPAFLFSAVSARRKTPS